MTPIILAKGLTLELDVGSFPAMLVAAQYSHNGALALQFISDDDLNEPLCIASVNVEPTSNALPFNQFVCKSYSENSGMFEYLTDTGIAEETGLECHFGHVCGPILQLNAALSAQLKEHLHVQAH